MKTRFRAVCCALISVTTLATLLLGLQSAALASPGLAPVTESMAAPARTAQQYPWKGSGASCQVRLPLPRGIVSYKVFTTCPPKRVLIIGDSVALSMGTEMAIHQQNWGTLIDDRALLGCGFVTGYDLNFTGKRFSPMNPTCSQEASQWIAAAQTFKPQAIVVELGWWDSQEHMINGNVAVLGQPAYDSLVEEGILNLIHQLRTVSVAPIYFLSVPWMDPPAFPNGQPNPAASAAFHAEINNLIATAMHSSPTLHFIDVSPYLTPSGQYQQNVGGQICRNSDGVHLYYEPPGTFQYVYTQCGRALQNGVLSTIREALARH